MTCLETAVEMGDAGSVAGKRFSWKRVGVALLVLFALGYAAAIVEAFWLKGFLKRQKEKSSLLEAGKKSSDIPLESRDCK